MLNNDTPKYPIYDNGQLHISISQRNGKLGNIPQFNTLPGDEPLKLGSGKVLTNIVGTCGNCCADCKTTCYAVRAATYHHNSVVPAWGRNTVILRNEPEKVLREITEFCQKNVVKYFRFHTAGELEHTAQLELYCEICRANPDVIFYIYTKRFDLLAGLFLSGKYEIPENFVINLSEWHGNLQKFIDDNDGSAGQIKALFDKMNVFAFDDKTENSAYAATLVHCPAIDNTGHETGVTCAQCRRCMKAGHKTAVYSH
jgi:hypothetical protein